MYSLFAYNGRENVDHKSSGETTCTHERRYNTYSGEVCLNCDAIFDQTVDTPSSGSRSSSRENRLRNFLITDMKEPAENVTVVLEKFQQLMKVRGSKSMKKPTTFAVLLMLTYKLHREKDEVYPLMQKMQDLSISEQDLKAAKRKVSEIYDTSDLPQINALDIVSGMLSTVNVNASALLPVKQIYDFLLKDSPVIVMNTEMKVIALALVYFYLRYALRRSEPDIETFARIYNMTSYTHSIQTTVRALTKLRIEFQPEK